MQEIKPAGYLKEKWDELSHRIDDLLQECEEHPVTPPAKKAPKRARPQKNLG